MMYIKCDHGNMEGFCKKCMSNIKEIEEEFED